MPRPPTNRGTGLSRPILLFLVLAALVGVRLRMGGSASSESADEGAPVAAECPAADPSCSETAPAESAGETAVVIDADEICLSSGYLCARLEEAPEFRVARWNDDTERITIRIPTPPGTEPSRARALRQAVRIGVRAWHGRPILLRVDLSDHPGSHDIVVRWTDSFGDRKLGRTRTRWVRTTDGRADMEVVEFSLATRNPADPSRPLDPREVRLAAAHEMGHALGLPHSDRRGDVMYPENTAIKLSARDFKTVHALYDLENGALVR